jgi:hypothetical protein
LVDTDGLPDVCCVIDRFPVVPIVPMYVTPQVAGAALAAANAAE